MIASMVLDDPINRDFVVAYVRQMLVSELSSGDINIMGNWSSYQAPAPREAIKAAVAALPFLSLCIVDFDLINGGF